MVTLLLDELRRPLLLGAADLADHHHGLGVGVLLEGAQAVDEVGARDRVAADADARGLPYALLRELVQRLVGQCARARDDAHRSSRQRDVARGDADVALAGADDPRTVRTQQPGARELLDQAVVGQRLVLGRDALGDADDEGDAGLGRLNDGVRRGPRGHADEGGGGARLLDRLGHRGVDRNALDLLAAPLGVGAAHDLGAVGLVAQAVVEPLARRADALDHDLGRLVDEDAHVSLCPLGPDGWSGLRLGQRHGAAGGVEHGRLGNEGLRQVVGQQRPPLLGVGAVEAHDDG